MEELRSYWQVSSVAHFCYLFRESFKLPEFEDEELELAFLSNLSVKQTDSEVSSNGFCDGEKESKHEDNLLRQIIIILLRGYFKGHIISDLSWEQYLIKLFDIHWVGIENLKSPFEKPNSKGPDRELVPFDDLPLFVKVDIVYHLCEYRLYPIDAQNAADLLDVDSLRLEPIGTDSEGYVYYYFHGTRLYRENPNVSKRISAKLNDYDKRKKKAAKAVQELNGKPKAKESGRKVAQRKCRVKQTAVNGSLNDEFFDESVSCGIALSELKEGWSVVCFTLEDWKSLELKLSTSKYECDLELHKFITEHLIKKITDSFVQKEKEARKKLLELLPRRGSSRLEAKKLQKEQEEKRLQEEFESRKRKRAEAEERAKMDEERLKQETLRKERERRAMQRLALIEETAASLQNADDSRNENETEGFSSESNNSSDVYNGNAAEESFNNYRVFNGWHEIDSTNSQLTIHELYEGLPKVIAAVMSNRDAWPFKEAVDDKTAPLYYQVIEEPIDLSIIEAKINDRLYNDLREVESDFKLMVNNCETYNGPRNGYTLMAYATWKAFKRAVQKYLNRALRDDEKSVFIYPPKVTNNNPRAAIEARKRKRKHRRGMKALEVLAQAAEMAVKDTSSRSSSVGVAEDVKLSDAEEEIEPLNAYKVHGSTLARYVYTNVTPVSACQPDANLTFKTLSEWSESLKQSGNSVILPQNTVFVSSSPITNTWVTNGPLTASTVSTAENGSEVMKVEQSVNSNTQSPVSSVPDNNSQRLVIKLSKCNDGGTTLWQLSNSKTVSSQQLAPQSTVLSALKEQSSINQQANNSSLKHLSNSCIPVKKRLYIPPTDSECENNESFSQMNLNETASSNVPEDLDVIKSIGSNQATQKFQITGLHSSKNSNIKVLRLKRMANESQFVFVPPSREESDSNITIPASNSLNIEMKTNADGVCPHTYSNDST